MNVEDYKRELIFELDNGELELCEIEEKLTVFAEMHHQSQVNNVVSDDVSSYYFLVDGDEVRFGDEYYDCDEVNGWVEVELSYRFDYVSEEMYKMRRKK